MTARLDLKPRHRKQLESLLSEHLPGGGGLSIRQPGERHESRRKRP